MSDTQVNKRNFRVKLGPVVSPAASVFEEPFPKLRTLHWTPQMTQGAAEEFTDKTGMIALVVAQEVLLKTNRHVAQRLDRELGGFLLGNRYHCPNTDQDYVIIDQYLEADYTEGTEVSLNFTPESWAQLNDQLSGKFLGKLLVGWYHSHPRMNVFLSSHDVAIHQNRFPEPWKTALVIEPAKHLGGFFCWQGDKLDRHNYTDFYELLEGESRESVVSWTNYVGSDPRSKSKPAIKSINTRTGSNDLPAVANEDGRERKLDVKSSLPASPLEKLPTWFGGKSLWAKFLPVGVIVILIFIVSFALAVSWFRSPSKAESPSEARTAPNGNAEQAPEVDQLTNLLVNRTGNPTVDFQTTSFNVDLEVSGLPEEIIPEVQKNTRVLIENLDAELKFSQTGRDGFHINASTQLGGKINPVLKDGRGAQSIQIKPYFRYKQEVAEVELTVKVEPPKKATPRGPVVLVVKDEKKKTIRRRERRAPRLDEPNRGRGAREGDGGTGAAPDQEQSTATSGRDADNNEGSGSDRRRVVGDRGDQTDNDRQQQRDNNRTIRQQRGDDDFVDRVKKEVKRVLTKRGNR